jgi:hypothetical protein
MMVSPLCQPRRDAAIIAKEGFIGDSEPIILDEI